VRGAGGIEAIHHEVGRQRGVNDTVDTVTMQRNKRLEKHSISAIEQKRGSDVVVEA